MRRLVILLALVAACGHDPDAPADSAPPVDAAADDATTDAELDASSPDAADVQKPTNVVRLMAANITSGTQQSYQDPGIRIFQGLDPDVVMIQELNYKSGTLRDLVDDAFGTKFSFYVEPSGNIPNGIVSRYPILDSGTWVDASTTDRAFAWALVDLPGPIDLYAVSVHLLTTGATQRDTEAKQLLGYIQASVPQGAYLAIGGDFNTDTTTEDALADLAGVVTIAPPFPADQDANSNTSTNRNRPHDWLLVDPTLQTRAVTVWVGASQYPSGLVFDSRVYTPLSEVAPVMASDSAATGMQHMPVVRDFAL